MEWKKKIWTGVALAAGLFAIALVTTACSDSDSSSAGGGAGNQSVVTVMGAAQ